MNEPIGLVVLWGVLLVAFSKPALGDSGSADKGPLHRKIDTWLAQGPRADFECKVKITKPALTFQQRHLVWVNARVSALEKNQLQRDLLFVVRVAGENGRWLDGEAYNRFRPDKRLEDADLVFGAALYLQPGSYRIAVIAYDQAFDERNVSFHRVRVKASSGDAELLRNTPAVEFLPSAGVVSPIGEGHAVLPLESRRPVEIDWLVDLSPYSITGTVARPNIFIPPPRSPLSREPRVSPTPPDPDGTIPLGSSLATGGGVKNRQAHLLQTASLLTDLQPQNGCTRVLALNNLNRQVITAAAPANSVDWQHTWNEVLGTELSTVSVADLQQDHEAGRFFAAQLEKLMGQGPCDGPSKPLRIIAILSHGAQFSQGTVLRAVHPGCDCKVFYFQQREYPVPLVDHLQPMLKPLSPVRVEFSNPEEFRKKLNGFIHSVEKLANTP